MGSIPVRVTKKEQEHESAPVLFCRRFANLHGVCLQTHGFENLTKAEGSLLTGGSADSAVERSEGGLYQDKYAPRCQIFLKAL